MNDTITSLVAGGCAGMAVDLILFPLDTLKTRLQRIQSTHTKGFYRGLSSAMMGSLPTAALFFVSYDTLVPSVGHFYAASIAEIMACWIRVPIDNIKQRMQVGTLSLQHQIHSIYTQHGIMGFYRSYGTTIMRDVPFAAIQFPLYEYLKQKEWNPWLCGMVAGGTSAALTTPIDVLKTNVTLRPKESLVSILSLIHRERAYWRGIQPRVIWISMGGAIFLGTHDAVKQYCSIL
jgi:solute carrier family 25 S-adenosylmethionine transporter 26